MDRAIEAFVALTSLIVGASHLFRPTEPEGECGEVHDRRQAAEADGGEEDAQHEAGDW